MIRCKREGDQTPEESKNLSLFRRSKTEEKMGTLTPEESQTLDKLITQLESLLPAKMKIVT